jgi:hypothetical protein
MRRLQWANTQRVPTRGRVSVIVGIIAIAAVLLAGQANAVSGYPPGPFPGAAPAGSFPTVLASQSIGPSGGTISVTVGSTSLTLVVPANAFSQSTQVTIYGDDAAILAPLLPSGLHVVLAFAVGWTPASTASSSLTLTIHDGSIVSGDNAYLTTASGLTKTSSVTLGTGTAQWSFTADPGLVLAGPGAAGTPPNTATSAPTSPSGSGPVSWEVLVVLAAAALLIAAALSLRVRNRPGQR